MYKKIIGGVLVGILMMVVVILLIYSGAGTQQTIQSIYIPGDNPTVIRSEKGIILSIEELPKESSIAKGFKLSNQSFSHVALSPDCKKVAFSVRGSVHDWTGLLILQSGEIKQLTFIYGGAAGKLYWSPNSEYLAIENRYGSGLRKIDIVDATTGVFINCNNIIGREFHSKGIETYSPQWFNDNNRLSFKAKKIGEDQESLWIINLENCMLSRLE